MAKSKATALNLVNAINNQVSHVYNVTLPAVNHDNFSDMASQLRNSPDPVQNMWYDTMLNVVGMQMVKNKKAYKSYFRKLHKYEVATNNIQISTTNLLDVKAFSKSEGADEYFSDAAADVQNQYITSVFREVIPLSINRDLLFGAFINEESFMEYMNSISTVMYNTYEVSDVEMVKKLINQNIDEGNIYLIPLAKPTDKDTSLKFTQSLKTVSSDMAVEMNKNYNLAGCDTITYKEDGIVFTTTDVEATTETYSLAWAFNEKYLDLQEGGQGITMGSKAIENGDVYALYADNDTFEIHNIIGFPRVMTKQFENTLTTKSWLHYQGIYAVSYLNNCVAYVDPATIIGNSDITFKLGIRDQGVKETYSINRGSHCYVDVMSATLVPAAEGKHFDKFGTYALSGNVSPDTYIDLVSGKLVVAKDETATKLTVTFLSHLATNGTAIDITVNA